MKNQDVVTIEFHKNNDTNDIINSDIVRSFGNNPLLEDTSNLFLYLSRFIIPLTSVEIARIEDPSQYYITLEVPFQQNPEDNSVEIKSATSYFFPRSKFKIFSPTDYLHQINRCFYDAYRLLCGSISSNAIYPYHRTISSNLIYNDTDIDNDIVCGALSGDALVFVQLKLSDFQDNTETSDEPLVSIYLISPTGEKALVASAIKLEANKTYVFSDVCLGLSQNKTTLPVNNNGNAEYTPLELFSSKFYNIAGFGTWTLRIQPCSYNLLDFSIDSELYCQHVPKASNKFDFSPIAPVYTLNKSSSFLSLSLHEKFIISGVKIKPSPKLKQLVRLDKASISDEFLQIVPRSLTYAGNAENCIVTFEQEIPKLYLMSQIEQLLIESNNLSISRDLGASQNVLTNVISSFVLNADEVLNFNQAVYSYDGDTAKLRRYRFNPNSGALSELNLKFSVKYTDGSVYPIELLPGETVSGLVSIAKIE
jgi:hypothetical protein